MDYLHEGGLSYPSGHASNALLTWGMLAYLVYIYAERKEVLKVKLIWLYWVVGAITATVCTVSLIRKTHWFSDLLGGVFLGGSLLIFLVALDRAWPSKKQPS
jgi:membrane-associated phospholipid phosphatase